MNKAKPPREQPVSYDKLAEDLVQKMTLEEKASQMLHESPAIPRLSIPAYNWWNECLHGVGRAGTATVFPQPIGMAACFDEDLIYDIGNAISREARAKHQAALEEGDRGVGKGLTFWAPNINIFRDPRWGRGHETFGEDPYLTGRLGVRFIRGLQGDGLQLNAAAGIKHFAVHSGPESERHVFNAQVSLKDLYETYLPAFRTCVIEGKVEAVMAAYNRFQGEPCCGSPELLQKILREDWGFKGHVVSDCWGIRDFHEHHHVTKDPAESAALAISSGCDLNCGDTYKYILEAVERGILNERKIDESVARLIRTRLRLGLLDDSSREQNEDDPYTIIACDDHLSLAHQAACRSLVLLQNRNDLLPVQADRGQTFAVIGPNADSRNALLGNYNGTPPVGTTVLDGIHQRVGQHNRILYSEGCHLYRDRIEKLAEPDDRLSEAVSMARRSDYIILCLGLDATLEGEQGDISNAYGSGDKPDLELPGSQLVLYEVLSKLGKPLIVVMLSGSALWLDDIAKSADALIQAWYPGGSGGAAIAQMLFGDFSPSGRLPVTFYSRNNNLPSFSDYSMKGRTYKFVTDSPLYPFGFGLSYTNICYSEIVLDRESVTDQQAVTARITIENKGRYACDEPVQLYIENVKREGNTAHWRLVAVSMVSLEPGAEKELSFSIDAPSLASVDNTGNTRTEPGKYILHIGGQQPDTRSAELTGRKPKTCSLYVP